MFMWIKRLILQIKFFGEKMFLFFQKKSVYL